MKALESRAWLYRWRLIAVTAMAFGVPWPSVADTPGPGMTIRAIPRAFEAGDLYAMEPLWVHEDRVTVIENGAFNIPRR